MLDWWSRGWKGATMAELLTDAEARRMLELIKEALSPKAITLGKGEKACFEADSTTSQDRFRIQINRGTRNERKVEIVALPKGIPQTILELHLHPNQPHRNPDGTLIVGSHWHVYSERFGRRQAYPALDLETDSFVDGTMEFFRRFHLVRHPVIRQYDPLI